MEKYLKEITKELRLIREELKKLNGNVDHGIEKEVKRVFQPSAGEKVTIR